MAEIYSENFEFVPPPEAPVFEPTWDEFKDPEAFIEKIRDIGMKTGIIKIRPPPSWQPPFAVDVENFTFIPRLQKLNELEARSRVKLNFLDRVLKYWYLQGITLKVPVLERRLLDLYKLHKVVNSEGGFEHVCNARKWHRVAEILGYPLHNKNIGSTLRHHYEKILFPYDVFEAGASVLPGKVDASTGQDESVQYKKELADEEVSTLRMSDKKMPLTKPSSGYSMKKVVQKAATVKTEDQLLKPAALVIKKSADQYFCEVCNGGDNDELMLLCDGCDDAYHIFCLTPPLKCIPPGDWRCPRCIVKECSKPVEAFGFEEAQQEYTLYSFGVKADQFKSDYFKKSGQMVSTKEVEKEFWRLVNCIEEDVVVEYGADIHALEKGSGFPTEKTKQRFPGYEEYIASGWNLNNLPVLNSSVLRYIDVNISGMKVPWCYVGMCFSCFCWHVEDHWSYSVNYMHWGEPKTWYGVPSDSAELLEECMRKTAGELFENSPDLLHQLNTIMNPNVLMNYGVPMYRTDQCAGEFVVTFPRSYHAGFNQGYNFAEAVNYCPPDWLPWGRSCIDYYRNVFRQCVFSHDELLCMMTVTPSKLDIQLAKLLVDDLKISFDREKQLRKAISDQGVKVAKEVNFEQLTDDDRQCIHCQTTVFLSAFTCSCDDKKMWCIDHTEWPRCECKLSDWQLLYRYNTDEMDNMVEAVINRAECLERWVERAVAVLDAKPAEFSVMKAVASEVTSSNIPAPTDLLRKLNNIVHEAEECIVVAGRLTRRRGLRGSSDVGRKLCLDEIRNFCARVDAVPCLIREANVLRVQELLKDIESFQRDVQDVLKPGDMLSPTRLKQLVDRSTEIDIDITESKSLKWLLDQSVWLEEVDRIINDSKKITMNVTGRLVDDGVKLEKSASLDRSLKLHSVTSKKLSDMKKQLSRTRTLEKHIQTLLGPGSAAPELTAIESALSDCETLIIHLPCVDRLKSVLEKAVAWNTSVQSLLQRRDHDLHVGEIERFIDMRAEINVCLDLSKPLETKMANIKLWKEQLAKTFSISLQADGLLKVIFQLIDVTPSLSELEAKAKVDNAECDSGSALLEMLNTLERNSLEEFNKQRSVNQETAAAQNSTKSLIELTANSQCLLCGINFTADASKPQEPSVISTNEEYFCSSCRQLRASRPGFDNVARLVNAWRQLQVCLRDGRSLAWLVERVVAWRAELNRELETNNLLAEFRTGCCSDALPPCPVPAPPIEPSRISDQVVVRLQERLVQVMVLGVDLDEINGICHILLSCRKYKLDCERKKCELKRDMAKSKRGKRKSSDNSFDDAALEVKQPVRPKKQKEQVNGNKCTDSKKKRATKIGGKKSRKNNKSSSDSNYDTCSAKTCSQPVGSKINWVQCDGCELWYHLVCVGLSASQVADDTYEYHCSDCQPADPQPVVPDSSSIATTIPNKPAPSKVSCSSATPVIVPENVQHPMVSCAAVIVGPCEKTPLDLSCKAVPVQTSSAKPAISNLHPVFTPIVHQQPVFSVIAGLARPTFGLLATVNPQLRGVRPLDFRCPSALSLTNASQVSERTLLSSPGALSVRPQVTGPSLSFGQYLYTPWMNNSSVSAVPPR